MVHLLQGHVFARLPVGLKRRKKSFLKNASTIFLFFQTVLANSSWGRLGENQATITFLKNALHICLQGPATLKVTKVTCDLKILSEL